MNFEKANLSLSDSKINYENTSVDTNAGACFYSRYSRARVHVDPCPKRIGELGWRKKKRRRKR